MASYLLATVVLVVFACGVTGVQGGLGDACTDDANCTTATEACDATKKLCLLQADQDCSANSDKCVSNADCTGTPQKCQCTSGFEKDATRGVCNGASSVIFSATTVMLSAILVFTIG